MKVLWKIIKELRGKYVRNSRIHGKAYVSSGCTVVNSSFGKYSYCGYDCEIIHADIGKYCSVANNVIIGGANHPKEWVSTSPVFHKGRNSLKTNLEEFKYSPYCKTIIGNDVWIGNNVLIRAGVTIGDGAIIGMGSVVVKDVGSYEIWAGNPAKKVNDRFSDDVKNKLLSIQWWNLDDTEIKNYSKWIQSPEDFVDAFE